MKLKAPWSFETKFTQKKCIVQTEFQKTILELKISSLEHSIVPSFIFKKNTLKLGIKFAQKSISGTELKKKIVDFEISTCKYLFVQIFILNKALWSIGTKFAPKKFF